MKAGWIVLGAALATGALGAARGAAEETEPGARAFEDIARVLLSPRCRNCHPAGDAPLQGDARPAPHAMNVRRQSPGAGLRCTACHREANAAQAGAPPGAPGWAMPGAEVPMVFEGRTPRELCLQLRDPAKTGGRNLEALREHLAGDALVLWAWSPGPGRAPPPVSHAGMMKSVGVWVSAGAPCPP